MNISRNYLIIGSLYLLVGLILGMYMGGKQDFTLAPVHAHINLLGFTLMTLFGVAYRVLPQLADNVLARAHFWLHQIGALVLLIGLFLLMSGNMAEATAAMILPFSEIVVFLGMVAWAINVFRNV
jgi:cbb3-type cytochrome oxidase subunit 1